MRGWDIIGEGKGVEEAQEGVDLPVLAADRAAEGAYSSRTT
jgi:hypothetical protein